MILTVRETVGVEAFDAWGWRIPFLLSIVLLGISVWIRMQLSESPLFQEMKENGTLSKAPITESFFCKNGKIVLLALFGATAGQAVVWYAGQFYAMFFLDPVAEGRQHHHVDADRRRAGDRHAVLRLLRLAVGQDRPQADRHGRLPDRGADLLPAVPGR